MSHEFIFSLLVLSNANEFLASSVLKNVQEKWSESDNLLEIGNVNSSVRENWSAMRINAKHETSIFLIWKIGHCDHSQIQQTHQKVLTGQVYVNHQFFFVKMHFNDILIDIYPQLREVFVDYLMIIMVLILRHAQFLLLYSESCSKSDSLSRSFFSGLPCLVLIHFHNLFHFWRSFEKNSKRFGLCFHGWAGAGVLGILGVWCFKWLSLQEGCWFKP